VDSCWRIISYILPQRSIQCTRQNLAEELTIKSRKNNFKINDEVCFIYGHDIVFGYIKKNDPANTNSYIVRFIDTEETIDNISILYVNLFKTPQDLVNTLYLYSKETRKFFRKQLKEKKI
jgi:hypothetical protein